MGIITYEGPPPFGLLGVQSGLAYAVGTAVELALKVSDPGLSPVIEQIQIPLSARAAMDLGKALQAAALEAEQNALKK
jgi:hypothetical protein